MSRIRINYALAATYIAAGKTLEETAPLVGSASAASLQVGLAKRGLSVRQIKAEILKPENTDNQILKVAKAVTTRVKEDMERMSGTVRANIGAAIEECSVILRTIAPAPTLQGIKEFGDAIEPLVRSARSIYSWDDDKPVGIIAVGVVGDLLKEERSAPAINITSQVVDNQQSDSSDVSS